ncbi:DEAD/DEAH box helicase [Microbulbifer salipaludis]|uniref:DEAD/DEAH box helicase n=1 Tax=Microbulbifer salipaludis TaxID=187980 RepID=A0ABS3E8D4_9GAMM|nr:DEAD/DEAH box helicase [Microbulbifer salipaludis]MBN8431458.1 DEAD/DEAH box helicase [Microbulbifer salipaludis]
MSEFDKLHPAVQHHIVNSLGWSGLRPLQEATIGPVLNGEHAILLAPTAGGKTEAASFPIFSRMLSENWQGLSVLYICPIKALLNNLEQRLSHYGHLLGRTVALWHGDIRTSRKEKIISSPPDILLTTPESLEVMLVSSKVDHQQLFADVRSVIIDEVHAFAGDDRGWHLLAVLERICVLAGRELQRLGLSATVGNPELLCDWLAGNCEAHCSVINPPAESNIIPDVQVDWVGSLRNAAIVISRLHKGEKRLVFVDSRSKVEELAVELRSLGVSTFISHSSLSLEERRSAEEAFSQSRDCVIVATSTLELGIDVGDLDRVIQIDAPYTVASFLQRIGRTGRRHGSSRNCLFLATKEDAFLRAVALLNLWRDGYVEPIEPPPRPSHIYAQQIMALSLQQGGIVAPEIDGWVSRMPGFSTISENDRAEIVRFMLDAGILHSDQGVIGIGSTGERSFGPKNFMELFSVFTTPPMVKVFWGKQELGEVHQLTFAVRDEGPSLLTLGGRSWQTKYVDWGRKKAYVEPSEVRGRSQWVSDVQPMQYELCRALADVLMREDIPEGISSRGQSLLSEMRESYDWLELGKTTLIMDEDKNASWWNFSGKLLNSAIQQSLADQADKVIAGNMCVEFKHVYSMDELVRAITEILAGDGKSLSVAIDEDFVQELKFSECLSQLEVNRELACRFSIEKDFSRVSEMGLSVIKIVE